MTDPIRMVRELADRLPVAVVQQLATAAAGGPDAIRQKRATADSPTQREACQRILDAMTAGTAPAYLAGALAVAAAEQADATPQPAVVWTGPGDANHGRLTLAVVQDLIAGATREVLLCSYATHATAGITGALQAAVERGVEVTLLLERPADNPAYTGPADPLPGVRATRLAWPLDQRAPAATLHAKLLVIDRRFALVGSANITGRAFLDNLECGVLLDDPAVASRIHQHLADLLAEGTLVTL